MTNWVATYVLSPRDANWLVQMFGYDVRAVGDENVWYSSVGPVRIIVSEWMVKTW